MHLPCFKMKLSALQQWCSGADEDQLCVQGPQRRGGVCMAGVLAGRSGGRLEGTGLSVWTNAKIKDGSWVGEAQSKGGTQWWNT